MAMTLADVRAKYPQYKDVGDQQLADALYKKYYPSADRREFDARIGLKPYDSVLTGVVKGAENAIPGLQQSFGGLQQQLGEAMTGAVDSSQDPGYSPLEQKTAEVPVIGAPLAAVHNAVANFPGNVISAAARLLPEDRQRAIAETGAKESLRGQLLAQEAAKNTQTIDAPVLSAPGIAATATTSTIQMLPAIAASILMRNPTPALATAYGQSSGQAYNQGRADQIDWKKGFFDEANKAGLPPEQARQYATLYGAAEAIPEALPLGVLLKEGGSLVPRVLKSMATEGISEGITQAAQSALDKGYVQPDMTWGEAWPQIVQAMAAGAVSGGVFGAVAHGEHAVVDKPAETAVPETPPTDVVGVDMPVEQRLGLPGPAKVLALPSPEQFAPAAETQIRRQPPAPQVPTEESLPPSSEQVDYQARIALQKTRQAETSDLLKTAREAVTPLGTFSKAEVGGAAAQRVNQLRIQTGRPLETPITIDELARARVPQSQIDSIIAARRPLTTGQALTPLDIKTAASAKNIIDTDGNFAELAYRATGQRNVERMTQAQLNALKSTIDSLPAHPKPVTVPIAEQSPFTDEMYGKALDVVRNQGRYTAKAIKDATGLKRDEDVHAIRDAMVRRGQLVQRGAGDYRLFDIVGQERQAVPDDLPPGAFTEHVVRRIPVNKIQIRKDGKSLGTFGSASEARTKIKDLRAAELEKGTRSQIELAPAADVAYGIMQNRYDEQGNLLGQVVVDTHRNEDDANRAAYELNHPDVGARYTATPVTPDAEAASAPPAPAPVRQLVPGALVGRVPEIVKRLNKIASDRKLPMLGVRVSIKPKLTTPEGDQIEGQYFNKLIDLTASHLDPSMSTDQVTEKLAQVMDHETIHALRAAGVLSPESSAWKTLTRYAKRAKRNNTGETYFEWANRAYAGVQGYENVDSREEEAIAEAFRAWASNRRNVVGAPASAFRQIVEWFKRLLQAVPDDLFRSIETGRMVAEALAPPGSNQPRARATDAMQEATAELADAQAAEDENAQRVMSRDFLRAQAQAREDRYGRSGPKTVQGTNPSKLYDSADIADRAKVGAIVDKYKADHGISRSRLMTFLPEDLGYLARVADAQQKGIHNPKADDVAKAYSALVDETRNMYRAIGPLEVEPHLTQGAPYDSAKEMMDDIAAGHLSMRLSDDMFGEGADNPGHPMYEPSGFKATDGTPLRNNDLLRIVHEVYGHGQSGFRDDPRGQYNAYHEHARLLSPLAARALATETLAQNAWQNYGPHLRRRDGIVPRETDIDYLPPMKKEFALQKAFVMPEDLIAADPGWAIADKAEGAETPRFSLAPPTDSEAFKRWFGGSKVVDENGDPLVVNHSTGKDFDVFRTSHSEMGAHFGTAQQAADRVAGLDSPRNYEVYLSIKRPITLKDTGDFTARNVLSQVEKLAKTDARLAPVADRIAALAKGWRSKLTRFNGGDNKSLIRDTQALLKEAGYDGVEYLNRREAIPDSSPEVFDSISDKDFATTFPEAGKSYIAFDPTQIKSVDNRGTFDPTDARMRYSKFDEDLPGGRLYGNPNKSPGGQLSKPGTPTPAFTSERPGNRFFGGEMAEHQLQLARTGERGTAMVYLHPQEFLDLTGAPANPEQQVYDDAVAAGYKLSTMPSLVIEGYAGNVRATNSDGHAGVQALLAGGEPIPVVIYPKKGQSLGLVTALEGNGVRVSWPHEGRAENFPAERVDGDPKYSMNADFGERVQDNGPADAFNIVQQRTDTKVGNFLKGLGRSKKSLPLIGSIFDARVKLQDKMLSWKELTEQAKENHGVVDDINDVYMLEQLYHGKVFEQISERENELHKPLLEALKLAHDGPLKIEPKEFEDYLYARHAPERNAYLRTRGAPEANPSGMSDSEANTLLNKFALDGKLPELESLARLADRVTADTTRTRVDAGLISQEAANASPYQYYVPLRGFADEDLDPGNPSENQTRARSGKGFSVGGREDRTVTGRGRKAGDILGHLFLQNTEAVIRGQKNEVALGAMRFIQDNEALGFGQILKTAPTRRVVGANGMIHEAGDPTYRQQPDIVTAKWKGKEIVARLEDPRLARAIKSDYVTTSNDLVNGLVNWAGKLNRFLATVNTSFNPEFLISNLARDAQTAGILSQQYDIPQFGRKILGNAPAAMAGIREVLRKGTADSEWAQTFKEMQAAGGTTEFLGIHDLETQVARIRRSVSQTGLAVTARKAQQYLGHVGQFINDYNKVTENALRLSAYKAARDAGVSIPKAAYLAKNLTVNFNKGGELKGFMNAMYLFYNASTQGSFVLLNGLKNKRVQRVVAGVVAMGVLQDVLNRLISGDDDKNGVTDYDDIPDYVLETNFVLMDPLHILGPRGYFALPMPYGFNGFYNLGRNLSAGFSGSPVRSPAKSAVDSLTTFMDAFNPLGGVQSIWNFIAPTIADPFVDLITNKDFAGNDIVPERPSFGLPVPDSQKYWSNTSEIPKAVADHLNSLTGGDAVRKGAIDVSPEVLQYAFDYATGAAGKFFQRGAAFAADVPNMLHGDFSDVNVGDIPFARRVVGSVTSRGNTERYYQVAQEVATVQAEIKMYEDSGNREALMRTVAQHPAEVRLGPTFDDGEKTLADLRKQIRDLRDNKAVPDARKHEIEKTLKDRQDLIMAQLNKLYFATKKTVH